MFSVSILDERNIVSSANSGTYFVIKKNTLAQFSFGRNGTFETAEEAFRAMRKYLASRKDQSLLRVQINEFL